MTLAGLRTSLQALGYGTDTATAQTELLNRVYRRLCGERHWPWLERRDTSLVTTAGDNDYSLSSITDLVHILSVQLQLSTNYYVLEWVEDSQLLPDVHLDRQTGVPQYWTYANQQLQLYPYPDQAYTIVLRYIYDPVDLSADGDVPVFPATYHDILVSGALMDIAQRERDWAAYDRAKEDYESRKNAMVRQTGLVQRQNPGRVVDSGSHISSYDYGLI